jgi:hypothetical protein
MIWTMICTMIPVSPEFSKLLSLCPTLLNRSKAPIFLHRVSAERIGLARESGLADDLLQNPMLNRLRFSAAIRVHIESRQRKWPEEP